MHPVAIEFGGEIGAVVHDEGDAAGLRDRLQDTGGAPDDIVVDLLEAQLQARNIAAGERLLEVLGETVGVERRGRYQVEPRRRPRIIGANGSVLPLQDSRRGLAPF
jgi:hypothetical protein